MQGLHLANLAGFLAFAWANLGCSGHTGWGDRMARWEGTSRWELSLFPMQITAYKYNIHKIYSPWEAMCGS